MASWKITLRIPRKLIPAVEEIIYGLDGDNFPTLSDFEIPQDDSLRLLEAYFTVKPDLEIFRRKLGSISALPPPDITLLEIEAKDWVAESRKLLPPVDTGRFFIYRAHDSRHIPPDRINLLIEAGPAFGTGQHETTWGCLVAIEDMAREFGPGKTPKSALDLGCGSGLLALAMSKIWPITIVASDIDPVATATTRLNATVNHTAIVSPGSGKQGLAVVTGDGFEKLCGPYDVIVANILAKPLRDMAPDIVRNLSDGGSLILSGLLDSQEEMISAAYARQGMTVIKRYGKGEWVSLMLRRTLVSGD